MIAQSQRKIKSLLAGYRNENSRYLAPKDVEVASFSSSDIKNYKEISTRSAKKFYDQIITFCEAAVSDDKFFVELKDVGLPSSSTRCPTAREVEKDVLAGRLSMTFYSTDGFNFSAEFLHIYKARSHQSTKYKDIIAICKRALICTEPSLQSETLDLYCNYILRIVAWEADLSSAICEHKFKSDFPSVRVAALADSKLQRPLKVYIGKLDTGKISFWVRFEPLVTRDGAATPRRSLFSSVATAQRDDNDSDADESDAKKRKETTEILSRCSFLYYRRFSLTTQSVGDLSVGGTLRSTSGGDGGKAIPVPPPRLESANDLSVFLSVSRGRGSGVWSHNTDAGTSQKNAMPGAAATVQVESLNASACAEVRKRIDLSAVELPVELLVCLLVLALSRLLVLLSHC